MKRKKLITYLEKKGCSVIREGSNHSLYRNIGNGMSSTVPRHADIKENLYLKICKDLGIPDILNP